MPKMVRGEYDEHILDYSDMIPLQEQVTRTVAERIATDIEGKFRKALIELGWTPPPDKN